jgi:hypothetical protein
MYLYTACIGLKASDRMYSELDINMLILPFLGVLVSCDAGRHEVQQQILNLPKVMCKWSAGLRNVRRYTRCCNDMFLISSCLGNVFTSRIPRGNQTKLGVWQTLDAPFLDLLTTLAPFHML